MADTNTFPLISGHLSLDLANTLVVRRAVCHDLLRTTADLALWFEAVREVDPEYEFQPLFDAAYTEQDLDELRQLRALLRQGFEQVEPNSMDLPLDWRAKWERLIQQAPLTYKLTSGKLIPTPIGRPLDALASLIAFDALQLLSSGDFATVRRCANPDCVLLFMDVTGRRKWCSMKLCGNRAKVARHHSRITSPFAH
jgi:predicted RNA-binding Zn ribbon-like protein